MISKTGSKCTVMNETSTCPLPSHIHKSVRVDERVSMHTVQKMPTIGQQVDKNGKCILFGVSYLSILRKKQQSLDPIGRTYHAIIVASTG